MTEHTSKQFDAELERVRSRVLQMGGLVEEQITRAMESLISGDMALIDKVIGQQYSDNADTPFYKLPAYTNVDFKTSYTAGVMEFGFSISNLLNSRDLGAVGINDKTTAAGNPTGGSTTVPLASGVADVLNRPNSLDQYYYQPERGYQVSVKVRF